MPTTLPEPSEDLAIVDWSSETIKELREEGMYDEMIDMASGEFENHVEDLKRMKCKEREAWSSWPPWKVAHSIKGLCLSLGFERLAKYAQSIEKLKDDIVRGMYASVPPSLGGVPIDRFDVLLTISCVGALR
mmetsp:Transcript_15922/g.64186  ORF Transcript_15922/g.64186 Transcript_15922/m.64186 type:complete len:132 (+) Transcript_15922:271-666(+)